MGTYIRTCAETRTTDGWQPVGYGAFPPAARHDDSDDHETPAYSEPFMYQDYCMFGLFADVRNYSQCQVLAEPRGFPEDISEEALRHLVPEVWQLESGWGWGEPPPASVAERIARSEASCYDYSWLSAVELTTFNYDQRFIDQRTTPPHETTYHAFLGERYFQHLDALKALSAKDEVRILFRFVG
ncbi:hypothetical protein RAC65_20325 [Pantoea sp. BS_8]|uniref:hypothetical protein n=1 Tax=Pantoea sp. BS_8 TaxID=3055781 RepID=UPI0035BFA82D